MAISDIKKKRIGRELREWVFLGVKTGMRRGAEIYEQEKVRNSVEAIAQLKRAVDLPRRAKTRIETFINARPGNLQLLADALAMSGTVTLSEIRDELDIMIAYAQGLKDSYDINSSWDILSEDIRTNVENESLDWIFKLPVGYVDIWGE